MEQQGTVNNRTFVLLNFRSIILAPTIYHITLYYIIFSYVILYDIIHTILYDITLSYHISTHIPGNIPFPTAGIHILHYSSVPSGDVAHIERPILRGIFQGSLATLCATRPWQLSGKHMGKAVRRIITMENNPF